ncbi:Protein SMG7 [Quillaja saponaria]|uniref:Protein SMG7 n=1 Tax=Quillaja saponaria TaxID=32244 RepID=A0AAD7PV67_QUISA|nr:Protein SMG7 [Quillaja saponaria]
MACNHPFSLGSQKERQILIEFGNSEKQLWALIHSKGLLHRDAQELYRKVRCGYEKIIISNFNQSELQDVEYSLWKLHYKHIDEFRKRIKKGSDNAESTKSGIPQISVNVHGSNENHLKEFRSFLSEATEFYQNLIVKLRKSYGVPEEALFLKKGCISTSVEPHDRLKCQFLCHRFLVCMGDLARYKQQYENPSSQNLNWSLAATHYVEATKIWPDSGNPQNQLAVLATYIGDEFLALYHCVRSLAVKEPFPDAWNNLILLLEKNRSTHLHMHSSGATFNFSEPSERSIFEMASQSSDGITNTDSNEIGETKLWSLLVRTISFFFIKSRDSLEEFPTAFASTMGELDKMMDLDDTKIMAALESYLEMDSARRGPFRALQLICVLIFVLKNLMDNPEAKESKEKNGKQQFELTQLALAATFNFMGRFVGRCLKASSFHSCPLSPAVLVFVEWSLSMLEVAEIYLVDPIIISRSAMSYFFGELIELLNQLNADRSETKMFSDSAPLWEDYELRGFAPLASQHLSLDFSGNLEHVDNLESGIELRIQRIIKAALKIGNRSNDSQKWIIYDELRRTFHAEVIQEKKESQVKSTSSYPERKEHPYEATQEHERQINEENPRNDTMKGNFVPVEEEEVILFRPLTRYYSAPFYTSSSMNDHMSPKDKEDHSLPSDECLRHATSLLMAQNPANSDPSGFHADITNFRRNKQEPFLKETFEHPFSEGPISAGPPSLSGWVLNRESLSYDREKRDSGISEHLQTIEEIVSSSLTGLSISDTKDSIISSADETAMFHSSSTSYSAPMPSAPLLPEDAVWFTDVPSSLSDYSIIEGINKTIKYPDASLVSGYSDWSATHAPGNYGPGFPAFMDGYLLPGKMTSSEWLRWYRENHNPERANNHISPVQFNAPGINENFHDHVSSRPSDFDPWGNPLSYKQYMHTEPLPLHPGLPSVLGADEHIGERLFHNYQGQSPYGCGAVTDLRYEPESLLEYLKDKEWQLQQDPTGQL